MVGFARGVPGVVPVGAFASGPWCGCGTGGGHARLWCERSSTEGAWGSTQPGTVGDCASHAPQLSCPGYWSWGTHPRRPSAPGCFEALGCLHRTAAWPPTSGQSSVEAGAVPVLVGAGVASGSESPPRARCLKWDSFPGGKGGTRQWLLRSRLHAPAVPPPD